MNRLWRILRAAFCAPAMLLLGGVHGDAITGSQAGDLIPEEVSKEIIEGVVTGSTFAQLATRLPNMSRAQEKLPILAGLPYAYFTSSSPTGLRKTSNLSWSNKYIYAEEMNVIVPVDKKILADTAYDLWSSIKTRVIEAFWAKWDAATMFGTVDTPATWPTAIVPTAIARGNTVVAGTNIDLYEDIYGENGYLKLIEEEGFDVTGHVGALITKSKLRGVRDTNGQPIFMRTMTDKTRYELDGIPIQFPVNGSFDATKALLISGDWKKAVYSIREDMTWMLLDQAVIQDESGNILFNLPQQGMVALMATMRLGWQLPDAVTRINTNQATICPFGALTVS